jgi:hypothetical protein
VNDDARTWTGSLRSYRSAARFGGGAARGRAAEAGKQYRRALAIKENFLGRKSPDCSSTCNNLGRLLHDYGAFARGAVSSAPP